MSSTDEFWAEIAFQILESKIDSIDTVNTWAKFAGHSRSWLGTYIKKVYGISPKEMLKYARFQKIVQTIKKSPGSTSCYVASKSGLKDEKAIYKFLITHFNLTFTELRLKILFDIQEY